jgi:hypothetical protein
MTPHDPALRITANLLCLWGLCATASCRRAKSCKGKPADCVTRYSPLVPEDARYGVLAIACAADDGISNEEMRAAAATELAALEAWVARVHDAANGQARENHDHSPANA